MLHDAAIFSLTLIGMFAVTVISTGLSPKISIIFEYAFICMFFFFFSSQHLTALCVISIALTCANAALWPSFSSSSSSSADDAPPSKCAGARGLKYLSGDALTDSPDCLGPNNAPYPRYVSVCVTHYALTQC